MPRRIVPNKLELMKQAQELLQAGLQLQDIATALDNAVGLSTISRWLLDPKGNIAKEERRLEEDSKIHELRAQGLSFQRIADEVGVGRGRVENLLMTPEQREAKVASQRKYSRENREKRKEYNKKYNAKAREAQLDDWRQSRGATGRKRIPHRLRERFVKKAMVLGVREWTLGEVHLIVEAMHEVLDDYPNYMGLYLGIYDYAVQMCGYMRRKARKNSLEFEFEQRLVGLRMDLNDIDARIAAFCEKKGLAPEPAPQEATCKGFGFPEGMA